MGWSVYITGAISNGQIFLTELPLLQFRKGFADVEEDTYNYSSNVEFFLMAEKPTYDELKERVQNLEHRLFTQTRFQNISRILFNISSAANKTTNLDALYKSIHDELSSVIDTANFFIAIYDSVQDSMTFPYCVDSIHECYPPVIEISKAESLTATVIRTGLPLLITKNEILNQRQKSQKKIPSCTPSELWLGVPLKIEGGVIGVMAVQSYDDANRYDQTDLEIMISVADQVALAIENQRVEKTLQESEQRYRRLSENSPDMFYRMSLPDGKYEYVSPAAKKVFGYPPEAWYENSLLIREIIHPDWHQFFEEQWENLLKGNLPPIYEYKVIHKDKGFRWLKQRNILVKDENGKIEAIEGVVTDITERKQMENVLQDSEMRMKALSDASFEAIFISEKGICLDQNLKAERMFGYTHTEIVGRSGTEWIVPEDRDLVINKMLSGSVHPYEVIALRKDGTTFPCEIQAKMMEYRGQSLRITALRDIAERKQTEEALRESEVRFHTLFENISDAVYVHDYRGRIFDVNHVAYDRLGYTREEMLKFTVADIDIEYPTEQSLQEKIAPAITTGPLTIESRHRTKDGRIIHVEIQTSVFQDYRKKMFVAIARDITARKRAEKALQASEEKFRILFQNHSAVKLIIAPDTGNIFDANKAAESFYGWSIEQLKKMKIHDINILSAKQVMDEMERTRTQDYNYFEFQHRLSDGSLRNVDVYSSLIETNGSELLYSILHDVTDRKQMETELVNIKNHWEKTFDAVWDWVFITDEHFKILRSNKASKEFVNLSGEHVVGKNCYDILHGIDGPIPDRPHSRPAKSQHRETMEFQMEDGRWILGSVDPMKTQNGDRLLVHIIRDITELKNKENEILSARKAEAFSTLSGGIAHDYNNLLTIIWGNISFLKEKATDELQLECFQDAERACKQARILTHQFITLSKGAILEKKSHTIEEILSAVIKKIGDPKEIEISVNIQGGIPPIVADQYQLEIAFHNIIQNSLEATAHGGQVEIQAGMEAFASSDQTGKCLKVSFKDTSKGISESNLLIVFDPYYTTKEMGNLKGSGLGLAVSMAIIKKHGGDIKIHSKIGQGTTVVVSLPLPDLDSNIHSEFNKVLSIEKPTILFMEDDPSISKLCERMLQRLNCNVIPAACSKEAIEKYLAAVNNNVKINLIFLDQNIKEGIGGIETLKGLRKCGYENGAIIITGSPNSPAILDFKRYGFDGRLLKPYTKRELKEVLRQFVSI